MSDHAETPDDSYDAQLRGAIDSLTQAWMSGIDWAEFVTLELAGAAANEAGIEAALAERPGRWEAAGVRRSPDGQHPRRCSSPRPLRSGRGHHRRSRIRSSTRAWER